MKYKYWTRIEEVGKGFENRMKIGEFISAPYKKESWEILDKKEGKIKFMCSGTYIGRTPENSKPKEILSILKKITESKTE